MVILLLLTYLRRIGLIGFIRLLGLIEQIGLIGLMGLIGLITIFVFVLPRFVYTRTRSVIDQVCITFVSHHYDLAVCHQLLENQKS